MIVSDLRWRRKFLCLPWYPITRLSTRPQHGPHLWWQWVEVAPYTFSLWEDDTASTFCWMKVAGASENDKFVATSWFFRWLL